METQLSCIPCIIKQIIYAAHAVSGDPWLQKKIVTNVLQVLAEVEYSLLPVTLVNSIFSEAVAKLGVSDPFQEEKKEVFSSFADILADIDKRSPEVDPDPFTAALKMSAAANHFPSFIDYDEALDRIMETAQKPVIMFEQEKLNNQYRKTNKTVLLTSGFMEFPFDVCFLRLMGMKEINFIASSRPFLWQITADEIQSLADSIPFPCRIREIVYTNPQNDRFNLLNEDEFIISKGFINYQYFEDYTDTILHLFHANRWCQPSMLALGLKNKPQSGIVMKFSD